MNNNLKKMMSQMCWDADLRLFQPIKMTQSNEKSE